MKKWNLEKVNKQTTHTAACLYTSHIKMDQNVYSNGYTAYNSGMGYIPNTTLKIEKNNGCFQNWRNAY